MSTEGLPVGVAVASGKVYPEAKADDCFAITRPLYNYNPAAKLWEAEQELYCEVKDLKVLNGSQRGYEHK